MVKEVQEVIFHKADLDAINATPDYGVVYFGTYVVTDPTNSTSLSLGDGTAVVVQVQTAGSLTGIVTCDNVIWNEVTLPPDQGYFYGYKFTVTV
jgi:hypothetical protein